MGEGLNQKRHREYIFLFNIHHPLSVAASLHCAGPYRGMCVLIHHGVAQRTGWKEMCHTVDMWGVSYIFLIRVSYIFLRVTYINCG